MWLILCKEARQTFLYQKEKEAEEGKDISQKYLMISQRYVSNDELLMMSARAEAPMRSFLQSPTFQLHIMLLFNIGS